MVNQMKCRIDYNENTTTLVYLGIGEYNPYNIERKDAEDIIRKFKDDKYIVANIQREKDHDILNVVARFPEITVDCGRSDQKSVPLKYTLKG
jgi:hypothetical protein